MEETITSKFRYFSFKVIGTGVKLAAKGVVSAAKGTAHLAKKKEQKF